MQMNGINFVDAEMKKTVKQMVRCRCSDGSAFLGAMRRFRFKMPKISYYVALIVL